MYEKKGVTMPRKLKEGATVKVTLCFKDWVVEKLYDRATKAVQTLWYYDETFKELSICKNFMKFCWIWFLQ